VSLQLRPGCGRTFIHTEHFMARFGTVRLDAMLAALSEPVDSGP
jgi:hypothetical protein